jgi:protein required for attachment to host cells
MDDTWIVVANQAAARVFAHRRGHELVERETLLCPQGRQPERAVLTDAPGRSHDRRGPARHAMEPHTIVGEQLATRFAHRIADYVGAGRKANAFDQLVLVAAPEFLGLLREELDAHCLERVAAECHKNIVDRDVDEIVGALPETVQHSLRMAGKA